jgi:hypothetical protein
MSSMLPSIGIGRITFFVAAICHIKRRLALSIRNSDPRSLTPVSIRP